MSGTELAYGGTAPKSSKACSGVMRSGGTSLRACYAMSGTDVVYGTGCLRAMSGTGILYDVICLCDVRYWHIV
eukprot:2597716-Rhodomonas_salina.2